VTFVDTNELDVREPREGWKGKFFRSESMGFAWYTVEAGAWIHVHQHSNDEVWIVVEGELEVTVDGAAFVAGPGCAAVVPPDTPHGVKALTDARAIVVDSPPRDSIGGVDLT